VEGQRKYLIGGNWKCNGTVESAQDLIKTINEGGPIPKNAEVVVGVPFIHIDMALKTLRDDVEVAAQNCGVNVGMITASIITAASISRCTCAAPSVL